MSNAPLIPAPGQRFNRLTFIEQAPRQLGNRFARGVFACDCGVTVEARIRAVETGNIKSCGCYRRELMSLRKTTHGEGSGAKRSGEYSVWSSMKARCRNPMAPGFPRYGARGIKVCDRWANSFEAFVADMGRRPTPKHSIERKDNDRDYCPENCRWATPREQSSNRAVTKFINHFGERLALTIACERAGVPYARTLQRLKKGYSDEAALSSQKAYRGPKKWTAPEASV